ncbi:MAG: DUF2203 domain-containing protein [Candidatus Limnocylindria bacterium]
MDDERASYTLEEARALLPTIRATLLQLAVERHRHAEAHAQLHALMHDEEDGDLDRAAAVRRQEAVTAELRARVRSLLDHLDSIGVEVRDLDEGLIDIPTRRDGEAAWLCWRLSDPELAFWHSTREGFASRKPL